MRAVVVGMAVAMAVVGVGGGGAWRRRQACDRVRRCARCVWRLHQGGVAAARRRAFPIPGCRCWGHAARQCRSSMAYSYM